LRAVKPAGTIWQIAKAKIFGDTEVRTEREFLVHYGDAKLTGDQWIGRVNQFAVQMDFAFVRRVNAGKNPAERAFARSILTDERMATGVFDLEANAVQGEHTREPLGNVLEGKEGHFSTAAPEANADVGKVPRSNPQIPKKLQAPRFKCRAQACRIV